MNTINFNNVAYTEASQRGPARPGRAGPDEVIGTFRNGKSVPNVHRLPTRPPPYPHTEAWRRRSAPGSAEQQQAEPRRSKPQTNRNPRPSPPKAQKAPKSAEEEGPRPRGANLPPGPRPDPPPRGLGAAVSRRRGSRPNRRTGRTGRSPRAATSPGPKPPPTPASAGQATKGLRGPLRLRRGRHERFHVGGPGRPRDPGPRAAKSAEGRRPPDPPGRQGQG